MFPLKKREVEVLFLNFCVCSYFVLLFYLFFPSFPPISFSQVLSSSDWQVLWDHLLSSPPSLLPCVAAAFTLASRRSLLSCDDAEEVDVSVLLCVFT